MCLYRSAVTEIEWVSFLVTDYNASLVLFIISLCLLVLLVTIKIRNVLYVNKMLKINEYVDVDIKIKYTHRIIYLFIITVILYLIVLTNKFH